MSSELISQTGEWTVGVRLWVERGGRALLGPGRVELLEGIDRWHSISAAARAMKMSYRRAWLLVQSMNEAAGEPLVEAAVGGSQGGGARLTPLGRWAAAAFRDLQSLFDEKAGPLTAPATCDETIHVDAAVSLEEVLGRLLADYSLRTPAVRVRVVYGASDELADRLLAARRLTCSSPPTRDRWTAWRRPSGSWRDRASFCAQHSGRHWVRRRDDHDASTVRPWRRDVGRIAVAAPSSPLGGYTPNVPGKSIALQSAGITFRRGGQRQGRSVGRSRRPGRNRLYLRQRRGRSRGLPRPVRRPAFAGAHPLLGRARRSGGASRNRRRIC